MRRLRRQTHCIVVSSSHVNVVDMDSMFTAKSSNIIRQAPATCGEFLQGAINGHDFLVNYPIDGYSKATITPAATPGYQIEHAERHAKVVRALVLCNPNNPTGLAMAGTDIEVVVLALADLDLMVIDESFIDFSDTKSATRLALRTSNLIGVKSLGKSIGWHGIRIGYAVAERATAERLRARVSFWNINGIAAFVLARMTNLRDEFDRSLVNVQADRKIFSEALVSIGKLDVYPSHVNFVFVKIPDNVDGQALRTALLSEHGLIVRACGNKLGSSDHYLRLAVNHTPENFCLIDALREQLGR